MSGRSAARAGGLVRLSAPVGAAPGLVSALALCGRAGEAPLVVVAGPSPGRAQGVVAAALRGAEAPALLALPDVTLAARPVDLADLGDGTALALVPGHALIRLDPGAAGGLAARRLLPGRALPDRLFGVGGAVLAAARRPDGRTSWTRLGAAGAAVAGSREDGPCLLPGQRLSRLLLDGRARLVALADDDGAGFAAWRREEGGAWRPLAERGAHRFAFNAAVLDAAPWGDGVAVAAGPSGAVRARLLGTPAWGELLHLGEGWAPRLLAGEARVAPEGLMLPLLGASGTLRLGRGLVTRLLARPDLLVASVERPDGTTALRGVTPAGEVTELGEVAGAAIPLALGDGLALLRLGP